MCQGAGWHARRFEFAPLVLASPTRGRGSTSSPRDDFDRRFGRSCARRCAQPRWAQALHGWMLAVLALFGWAAGLGPFYAASRSWRARSCMSTQRRATRRGRHQSRALREQCVRRPRLVVAVFVDRAVLR
jgi:hypothetical protein